MSFLFCIMMIEVSNHIFQKIMHDLKENHTQCLKPYLALKLNESSSDIFLLTVDVMRMNEKE